MHYKEELRSTLADAEFSRSYVLFDSFPLLPLKLTWSIAPPKNNGWKLEDYFQRLRDMGQLDSIGGWYWFMGTKAQKWCQSSAWGWGVFLLTRRRADMYVWVRIYIYIYTLYVWYMHRYDTWYGNIEIWHDAEHISLEIRSCEVPTIFLLDAYVCGGRRSRCDRCGPREWHGWEQAFDSFAHRRRAFRRVSIRIRSSEAWRSWRSHRIRGQHNFDAVDGFWSYEVGMLLS